ncbi:hypothetical protein J6590_081523 [Homalodisca vitripennis]|nr:hypothetical protein J6590_081523 [Homalodisca vitripennis]
MNHKMRSTGMTSCKPIQNAPPEAQQATAEEVNFSRNGITKLMESSNGSGPHDGAAVDEADKNTGEVTSKKAGNQLKEPMTSDQFLGLGGTNLHAPEGPMNESQCKQHQRRPNPVESHEY